MTSRDAPGSVRSRGGRAEERRSAVHALSLPSQRRSFPEKHTHGGSKPNKSMATYSRSRPDQDEGSGRARCSSDVSMEDGSEDTPSKTSSPAQMDEVKKSTDVDSKSGGYFRGKLQRMIEKESNYIQWVEEGSNAILIPNDKNFVTEALHKHFGNIKMESFEKQLRNYGYQKKTVKGAEGAGSQWVQKETPLPDDPSPQDGAAVVTSIAPRPFDQQDLEARIKELQNELSATRLELGETRTELGATRKELDATRTELGATRTELGATRTELSATRTELSATRTELSVTRTEQFATRAELNANRSELNETRSELKGLRNLISEGWFEITNTPTQQTSPGYGFQANPGISSQTYPGGQTTSSVPFPGPSWQRDSSITPQVADTSSGHQQNPGLTTGMSPFLGYNLFSPATPAPQTPARTQTPNHFGASGGPRNPVAYVQPMANPNTSNHGPQAQYAR